MTEKLFFLRRGPHRLAAVLHDAGPAAGVILAHGFTGLKAESGRLFVDTARALAAAGISALRFDFMGSGDSSGSFRDMTPNTEIADLHAVIDWARRRWRRVGVLGLSFGGAVSICTAAQRRPGELAALCTWSSVPSFAWWRAKPDEAAFSLANPHRVGRAFFRDRPRPDVPEAYVQLALPKLQVQGDRDIEGFRERFAEYFASAPAPKRHLVLAGADHVFTHATHRRRAIRATVAFFRRHLR